jgi:amino acid transporter
LAVSMVMGSGLLGLPGLAIDVGGVSGATWGWMLTAAMSVPLIHVFATLGRENPSSAGLARYAQQAVGRGVINGVTMVLVGTFAICIPVGTWIGAGYLGQLLGLPQSAHPWMAFAILVLMTAVNVRGMRWGSAVNAASVVALVVLVCTLVLANLRAGEIGAAKMQSSLMGNDWPGILPVWRSSALLFWAFLGWENLSFGLEEFKNPRRSIRQVFWVSFLIVLALYFSLAAVTIGANLQGRHVSGVTGLTQLARGTRMAFVLLVAMVFVVLANVNAWIYAASRLVYAAGRDRTVPHYLRSLSRQGTPVASLMTLMVAYSAVLAALATGRTSLPFLISLVSQNFVVLYSLCVLAYLRTAESCWSKLIGALAVISCVLLLSGFGSCLVYPACLMAIGLLIFRLRTRLVATTARSAPAGEAAFRPCIPQSNREN